MLRYIMLRYVMLRYVALYYVTLSYVTLCCVMLCYVTLRYVNRSCHRCCDCQSSLTSTTITTKLDNSFFVTGVSGVTFYAVS